MTKLWSNSIVVIAIAGVILAMIFQSKQAAEENSGPVLFWQVQSIDTMKYSRDLARQKLHDSSFDQIIEQQVAEIAKAHATHVAIGTPYDPEFLPILNKWVQAARRHNLNVWFRGNLSGWEGWFDYPAIDRAEHHKMLREFVSRNPGLFQDGDIFDPCPECENGEPGDPRQNNDLNGHRKFLMEEYKIVQEEFEKRNLKVRVVFSMNGDVARLVMDKPTAQALGNLITIDHYVRTPEELLADIKNLAHTTGAQILLGEFGAPVPDLHGELAPEEQKNLVEKFLNAAAREDNILGINYWVFAGGTTALWEDDGKREKLGVSAIKKYFQPPLASGLVLDDQNNPISNASIMTAFAETRANSGGKFQIPLIDSTAAEISAEGFEKARIELSSNVGITTIALTASDDSPIKKFFRILRSKF